MCSGFLSRDVAGIAPLRGDFNGRTISTAELSAFFNVLSSTAPTGGVQHLEVFQNESCVSRDSCHAIPVAAGGCGGSVRRSEDCCTLDTAELSICSAVVSEPRLSSQSTPDPVRCPRISRRAELMHHSPGVGPPRPLLRPTLP